jgi:predicted naringenin-chalcone synthase
MVFTTLEIRLAHTVPSEDAKSDTWVTTSIFVRHYDGDGASSSKSSSTTRKVDLSTVNISGNKSQNSPDVEADLRWNVGDTVVFCGMVVSEIPTSVKVTLRYLLCVRPNVYLSD